MNHNFATVPKAEIQRSSFDRSHGWKGTFDEGKLIPFFVDEVIPGDTFNLSVSMLCRLATPIVPIMDNLYLDTFFFFVPNRLVWDNFEKMMGDREDPDDSIDYLVPGIKSQTSSQVVEAESVFDYFGIPIGIEIGSGNSYAPDINSLPFRSYIKIWNDWFRDENLQDSIKILKSDVNGYSNDTYYFTSDNKFHKAGSCLPRNKRHDYFTSSLPWPQKGDSVDIPLGTSAPVYGNGKSLGLTDGTDNLGLVRRTDGTSSVTTFAKGAYNVAPGSTVTAEAYTVLDKSYGIVGKGKESGLIADLSSATAATINTLRQAFQIQRLLERDARGGTRYTEILRSHFNVVSPDARLQRPEYLGGSSTPFVINPVAQTGSTDETTPQGNLAAFGICGHHGHAFIKSFVEHGYIIGLCCVRSDLNYQQGLNRMWSKRTRYDFYWPSLAHLGEQAVLNKEIYLQGTSDDDDVFGYQERYAEYRYYPNMITGKFRSTYSAPLDVWHLGQKFDSLPTLSSDFIKEQIPVGRVVAVPSEPHFIMDAWFKLNCVRPMPLFGVPGLIDHF